MEQFKTIEEILSSDFAFIPDGYTQKAKSDRVLKSTRIEQAIFDDLYDDTSELADVEERGKRKLKSFDSLVNDVFQLIYGLREKYVDEKDMSELSKKFNKSIIQDLHKDDNFTAVKSVCEGKELLSISATEEFSGKLLENLDNLMDKATGGKGKVEGLEKIEQDKPDTIELESAFNVGDTFKMEYDWCKRKPAMNGYIMEWHKDTAVFKVKDIVCNMVINPHEVWIRLTSDDELFNHRCGIGVFDAPEKQILERKVA